MSINLSKIDTGNYFNLSTNDVLKTTTSNELIPILKIKDKQTQLQKIMILAKNTDSDKQAVFALLEIENKLEYKKTNDTWLFLKEIFSSSEFFILNYGAFLLRNKKFDKVLNLLNNRETKAEGFRFSLICEAAFNLGQYNLLAKKYEKLENKTKKELPQESLMMVANSYLQNDGYTQAMEIFDKIKIAKGLKPLPSIEAVVAQKMKTKNFDSWFKNLQSHVKDKSLRKRHNTYEWVKFSTILISENRFQDAVELLSNLKKEKLFFN